MNATTLKCLATFLTGFGVGFLICQKRLERKYATIADEEIKSVKEYLLNRAEKKPRVVPCSEAPNSSTPNNKPPHKGAHVPTRSSLDGTLTNKYEAIKRQYNIISDMDEEDDAKEDDQLAEEQNIGEEIVGVNRTTPYLISDIEFTEEFDHHDKISLYYYRVDDILCGDDEEMIEDIEESCGYEALSKLDMQTTVWVRNEPLCTDYEIISFNKSYAEVVHGIIPEQLSPREKHLRDMKRREKNGE